MNRRSFFKGLFAAAATVAARPLLQAMDLVVPTLEATVLRSATFEELLREYLTDEMMWAEIMKKDYMFSMIAKGDSGQGATIEIPLIYGDGK